MCPFSDQVLNVVCGNSVSFSENYTEQKPAICINTGLLSVKIGGTCTLKCVIPVVCVTNEREENVVKQHN